MATLITKMTDIAISNKYPAQWKMDTFYDQVSD